MKDPNGPRFLLCAKSTVNLTAFPTLLFVGHLLLCAASLGAENFCRMPTGKIYTNLIGMKFVRIEPGTFRMGTGDEPLPKHLLDIRNARTTGDFDEHPAHTVRITKPFYMGVCEVTNFQYELFDPAHKEFRGESFGLSTEDDEAAINVSWYDAGAFCKWLSDQSGLSYRLPTEAEWEYACRATTTTPYYTGDTWPQEYHKAQKDSRLPNPARLHVGQTEPNPWGLYDMHGNVEEWCHDWYGPYLAADQSDPVGRSEGDFRLARGGSHNTHPYYLRSSNRMAALPEDRNWLTGFRVVIGELPDTKPLPPTEAPLWACNVKQRKHNWKDRPDPKKPYFHGPIRYVKVPPGSHGPMFSRHNHDPGLSWCDNGDILAIWYSCQTERGRELCILASRFRHGSEKWDEPSPFWDAPDRNDHAPALLNDRNGALYHFNGLSAGSSYRENLALIIRISKDNGATWSRARLINPKRGLPSQPVASTLRTKEGYLVVPCDWPWHLDGRSTGLWISRDDGLNWSLAPGRVAGIHAGLTQLPNGRLLAFGRGDNIDGQMPKSASADMGQTWTYAAGGFPPVSGGQRLVLLQLTEGPLLLVSFTDKRGTDNPTGIEVTDAAGKKRTVYGMYAALSFDKGHTWPVKRLVTGGGPPKEFDGGAWTDGFIMDSAHAEPAGYLAGVQTPDGVIHIISSALHYRFNLAWLKTTMPAEKED